MIYVCLMKAIIIIMNETTVDKNTIRYNLKYDQSAGVIFSVSKVN